MSMPERMNNKEILYVYTIDVDEGANLNYCLQDNKVTKDILENAVNTSVLDKHLQNCLPIREKYFMS